MKTTLETIRKYAKPAKEVHAGFDTEKQFGKEVKTPVFYCEPGSIHGERFAHEVMTLGRSRHTGWYTNSHGEYFKDGHGLCRGVVVSFNPRPGFPDGWHIAGYNMNGDMCTYYPDVYADAEEAAHAADSYAEKMAEDEREYQDKWEAARELSESIDEAFTRLRECLALRNKPCFARLRDEARDLIETIREKRETMANDYADFVGEV